MNLLFTSLVSEATGFLWKVETENGKSKLVPHAGVPSENSAGTEFSEPQGQVDEKGQSLEGLNL